MPSSEDFSFVRRVSQVGTLLQTFLFGREVGRDASGNRYFCEKRGLRANVGGVVRQKRWVLYAGEPEPTKVPPEWHAWLHYDADAPLPESARRSWQLPPTTNKTGTPEAWVPPSVAGQGRPQARGDYEAWKPE